MPKQTSTDFDNALWRLRRQHGLEQKQAACLLGYKTTDTLSRYERGLQQPNLQNAIKLSLLYQATLAEMFPRQTEWCRSELERSFKQMPRFIGQHRSVSEELAENVHLCTYARLLEQTPAPSSTDLDLIKKHVTNLLHKLAYQ